MELIKTMLGISLIFDIAIISIIWLIIKSAVKAGIIAAYEKITNDPQKEKERLQQEIAEEQEGWS